jgi:hypothetical protein
MKRDTDPKITIEDLIRLKRSERPPAEFWATFEAEIRAKQLSAIVIRRPWWDGLSRVFAILNRHQLAFGATAAVALAWMGVEYTGSRRMVAGAPQTHAASVQAAVAVAAAPAPVVPVAERTVARVQEVEVSAPAASHAERPVVEATASHLTQVPVAVAVDSPSKSPFADGFAITLADYREQSPDVASRSVFGSDREFEPVLAASRQVPSEPLAQMDPTEERRERLLAPALPAYSSVSSRALASDWMRQRSSSDERMYESMDRASSDQALVGFRF